MKDIYHKNEYEAEEKEGAEKHLLFSSVFIYFQSPRKLNKYKEGK